MLAWLKLSRVRAGIFAFQAGLALKVAGRRSARCGVRRRAGRGTYAESRQPAKGRMLREERPRRGELRGGEAHKDGLLPVPRTLFAGEPRFTLRRR